MTLKIVAASRVEEIWFFEIALIAGFKRPSFWVLSAWCGGAIGIASRIRVVIVEGASFGGVRRLGVKHVSAEGGAH